MRDFKLCMMVAVAGLMVVLWFVGHTQKMDDYVLGGLMRTETIRKNDNKQEIQSSGRYS